MSEMSLDMRKVYSLTEFMRNYKAHLSNLKETKTPEVLTIKGRAEFVVLDADSYQSLLDRIHNAEKIT
jgi:PHD/YefM family antitoxin component YafN of YafNO toxin-antitoxin module